MGRSRGMRRPSATAATSLLPARTPRRAAKLAGENSETLLASSLKARAGKHIDAASSGKSSSPDAKFGRLGSPGQNGAHASGSGIDEVRSESEHPASIPF